MKEVEVVVEVDVRRGDSERDFDNNSPMAPTNSPDDGVGLVTGGAKPVDQPSAFRASQLELSQRDGAETEQSQVELYSRPARETARQAMQNESSVTESAPLMPAPSPNRTAELRGVTSAEDDAQPAADHSRPAATREPQDPLQSRLEFAQEAQDSLDRCDSSR